MPSSGNESSIPESLYLATLTALLVGLCAACVATPFRRMLSKAPSGSILPPGPRGWPLIGNVLDLPKLDRAGGFRKLCAKYGDLVHLKNFGQDIVVIGSYDVAWDLLDRRSAIYSDRPPLIMGELTGFTEWDAVLKQYGPEWRAHRRVLHQELIPNAIVRYQPVQRRMARQLLQDLLNDPKSLARHVERVFAGTALSVAYGLDIFKGGDVYIPYVREIIETAIACTVPGKYLVEAIPLLQHVPRWLPGAGFKREAVAVSKRMSYILRKLLETGKNNFTQDAPQDSILSHMLRNTAHMDEDVAAEEEEKCAGITATVYAAGADTTESAITAFFLAMALHPDAQKKAQAELDRVVGPHRLPDFSDRHALPYVNALLKELARWHVVIPTCVPHATIQDDVYNGYFIPKGSQIVPNAWAFSRDPTVYLDPERFEPERFLKDGRLDPTVRDPYSFVFGFGRRRCPGRHLADASLFIMCASILHAFNISPAEDADGNPLPLEARFTKHLTTSYAEEFECEIRARSPGAAALIASAGQDQ